MSEHGTKTRYSEDKCRCPLCRAAWNFYYRSRTRAVQRLIDAHRGEFDRYFTEEQRAERPTRGGYASSTPVSQLRPPPSGSAPGTKPVGGRL